MSDSSKLTRRALFGLGRGAGTGASKRDGFSLDRFYAERSAAGPAPAPEVNLRDGLEPVETSRIGVPELSEAAAPSRDARMSESAESIALPDLQSSTLDAETLDQLFFDLAKLAEVLDVRLKAAATARANAAAASLEDARLALVQGQTLAAQVRYRFQGVEWIDTLMKTADGVRLVRMRAPVRPSSSA
jgi:hypothetical protein